MKRVFAVSTAVCALVAPQVASAQATAKSDDITALEDQNVPVKFECIEGTNGGCDNVTYEIISQDPAGLGVLTGSGDTWTFSPASDYHFGTGNSPYMQPFRVIYQINGAPNPAQGTFLIRITPQPDEPRVNTPQQTTNEDIPLEVNLVVDDPDAATAPSPGFPVTLTGSGDSLTYTRGNQPRNGTIVWNFPKPVYTPNPNFNGTDSFTYTVSDSQNPPNVETETIDIVVNPVNDPPEAVTETVNIEEDQTTNITLTGTDPDGQTQFTFNLVQGPTNGTLTGQVPSYNYTPNPNFTGTDSIRFTVSDGFETSAEGTITINVGQADDPPVWGAGTPEANVTLSVDEGETLTFTALATDPDGDTITYALTGLNDLNGATFDTATGAFSWSPNYEDIGEYDVSLKATDPFNPAGIDRAFKIKVVLVDDDNDNLPKTYEESINLDPTKADTDGDTINDNIEVGNDLANPRDTDNDGEIDALDQDSDGDGLRDSDVAGRTDPGQSPKDSDADGNPDYREVDSDNDGTDDPDDNCPLDRNSGQENLDGDALGDVCDDDRDGDGVLNRDDACATEAAATANGCPQTERRNPNDDDEGCAAAGLNTNGAPTAPMMLLVAMLAMVGLVRRRR